MNIALMVLGSWILLSLVLAVPTGKLIKQARKRQQAHEQAQYYLTHTQAEVDENEHRKRVQEVKREWQD